MEGNVVVTLDSQETKDALLARFDLKNTISIEGGEEEYTNMIDVPCILCQEYLDFKEDSHAQVYMNMVMTEKGEVVEIQGTAEGKPFSKGNMQELVKLAESGIKEVIEIEKKLLD